MLTKEIEYQKTLKGDKFSNLKNPVKLGKKYKQKYYNLKNPVIYFLFLIMAAKLRKNKGINFFKAYGLIVKTARTENKKFNAIKK